MGQKVIQLYRDNTSWKSKKSKYKRIEGQNGGDTHKRGPKNTKEGIVERKSEDSCNILVVLVLERNFIILSGELNNISYFT